MTEIKRNIIINKAGGNASKNACTYKLSIPGAAIDALGVTKDDRGVVLSIEGDKIVIKKDA